MRGARALPGLSNPGKWFLASRPILSFRRRAYRQPAPDRSERRTLRACPARPEVWQACLSRSEQVCPTLSEGSYDHSRRGDHWPSGLIGIARFDQSRLPEAALQPVPPVRDRRTQSGRLPTRPTRREFVQQTTYRFLCLARFADAQNSNARNPGETQVTDEFPWLESPSQSVSRITQSFGNCRYFCRHMHFSH
jgi:hypothetical protein